MYSCKLLSESFAEKNVLDSIRQVCECLHHAKNSHHRVSFLFSNSEEMKNHYEHSITPKLVIRLWHCCPIPALRSLWSFPFHMKSVTQITSLGVQREGSKPVCWRHGLLQRHHNQHKLQQVFVQSSSALLLWKMPPTHADGGGSLIMHQPSHQGAWLPECDMLDILPSQLSHSSDEQRDIIMWTDRFSYIFGDILTSPPGRCLWTYLRRFSYSESGQIWVRKSLCHLHRGVKGGPWLYLGSGVIFTPPIHLQSLCETP